jgi:hypothetical protein
LRNAFSKKLENDGHMLALYTVWYNFVALVDAHDAAQPRKRPGRKA